LAFTVMSWLHTLVDRLFPAAPKTARNRNVLIVRRGLSAEYYAFCEILAKTNAAEVLLDRRCQQRRRRWRWQPLYVVQNRRHADRRAPVPSTWTKSNFILVQMSLTDDDRALFHSQPSAETTATDDLDLSSQGRTTGLRDPSSA
jgi:hypothetical protein